METEYYKIYVMQRRQFKSNVHRATGLLQEINKNNNKNFQTYYLSLHITEPGKDVQTHHKVSKMKEIIKIRTEKIKRNRD